MSLARRSSHSTRSEHDRGIARVHAAFIRSKLVDLPENYQAMLPFTDDWNALQHAASIIRDKFSADQARSVATAGGTR
ncbi:MAG TPA: hypothetical protein VHX86_16215 [Tepidisphaeraceae bacterium]|nr:hypothetical protein [Tepidisphaeraceae bacterium]